MKVGDIIVYTYHYSARIPEFARVVKCTPKTVWLEHVGKKWLSNDGYGQNGLRVPDFDVPTTPFKKSHRIHVRKDGSEYIKIGSYCIGELWTGNPENEYTD